ncbi:hypothetical protein VQH23_23065 [Pararoseomonas sp. SCSIO 73927]|uniref:hypothetical protein n=1 Tax=Pararoseomonas sp. SCSIO 73927 TaxID=3114537 RepID=UPI0030D50119
MNTNRPGLCVRAIDFAVVVAATMVLSRLISLLLPVDYYFTFESLFSDRSPRLIMVSLITKMAAPLLAGAACGVLLYGRSVRAANARLPFRRFARRLKAQWVPTLFLAGFATAFLSAWPMVVYWDLLANPTIAHLKPAFFLLYLIYMVAFGYVALCGLLGSIFLCEHFEGSEKGSRTVSSGELSRVGALWLLSSGAASSALELLSK